MFESGSKFKQIVCDFIAKKLLTKEEKFQVDKIFSAIDINGDGSLSKEEIKLGYAKFFDKQYSDEELDALFDRVDADGSGEIGYSEFVVGTMNENCNISNEKLQFAFKLFDLDGGGTITPDEVKQILKIMNPFLDADQLFKQMDINGDGDVSFDEFIDAMKDLTQ